VTGFVQNLQKELEATFKEEISVYFDINPHGRFVACNEPTTQFSGLSVS